MHVCMMRVWKMHISVIYELDACIYDTVFFVTNEPTDKAILGVGFTFDNCGIHATMKVFESGCHWGVLFR